VFKQLELSRKAIAARIVAMASAGVVIASLALVWYPTDFDESAAPLEAVARDLKIKNTGWETLGGTAIVITIVAALIIALAIVSGTTITRYYLAAAIVCAVLVIGLAVWRLFIPPPDFDDPAFTSVGRGPGPFVTLAGALLVIAASIWGLRTRPALELKPCPDCAGDVPDAARKCMHCGHQFA
jgi:hypothetical protein